jgi:hypothetical protein
VSENNMPGALQPSSGSDASLTVGSGEYRFAVEHDWLRPPPGLAWGDTHGLAQDQQGNLYVAHTVEQGCVCGDSIYCFDGGGNFRGSFGAEFRGGAHGLGLRREPEGEFLYVSDVTHGTVAKLTLTGRTVWRTGYPRESPLYAQEQKAFSPTNFAFHPNGDLFVADGYGSNHVLRYDRHGRYRGAMAASDGRDGGLNCPHGLIVDTRGGEPQLVVADRGNFRLQIFSLEGRHLRTVSDRERLRWPCHFDRQGELLVCPDLDSQVCLLDGDYRVVAQLGDGRAENGKLGSRRGQSRAEFTPGRFITPHAAIFLHNGDLLVAEWLPIGRITRLRRPRASTST